MTLLEADLAGMVSDLEPGFEELRQSSPELQRMVMNLAITNITIVHALRQGGVIPFPDWVKAGEEVQDSFRSLMTMYTGGGTA